MRPAPQRHESGRKVIIVVPGADSGRENQATKEAKMMNDGFESITLFSESGERVVMGRLWERQTAVLVFVRHLG